MKCIANSCRKTRSDIVLPLLLSAREFNTHLIETLMPDKPEDDDAEIGAKSHWLLWTIVTVFLVLAIVGMASIDYYFSPEAIAAHKVKDAVDD